MKKLINEIMTVALVVSFTGNVFATNAPSYNRTPSATPAQPGLVDRFLNYIGYDKPTQEVIEEPAITEAQRTYGLGGSNPIPTAVPTISRDDRNRTFVFDEPEIKLRNDINKSYEDVWTEEGFKKHLERSKKVVRPRVIALINTFFENSSYSTLQYKENGKVTNIQDSREYVRIEQFITQGMFWFAKNKRNRDGTINVGALSAHINVLKKRVAQLYGLSTKSADAIVHDRVISLHEILSTIKNRENETFVRMQRRNIEFLAGAETLNLVRENSLILVGYNDGMIMRNSDGTINTEQQTKLVTADGKEVTINTNLYLALTKARAGTKTSYLTAGLFGIKNALNSYFNNLSAEKKAADTNRRTLQLAADLARRNVTPEASAAERNNAARDLGIVRADGTINLGAVNLPLHLSVKAPQIVQTDQFLEMMRVNDARKNGGFYYPTAETHYILKVSAEEANRLRADFPSVKFENDGLENRNTLRLKVKNPRNNENIFIGYKLQPALLKKFSPLMIQETMMSQFREAGAHAATSFPMEALTFYMGIYVNTLLNLMVRYKNDPAALDKFWEETTSVPGQISFFAFMLGNRMFSNIVGANVTKQSLKFLIPFIGMGVGSIASALSHDVMTFTKSCAINMMTTDDFNSAKRAEVMNECEAAYKQIVSSANVHNYITSFMNIFVAGLGSAGVAKLLALGAKGAGKVGSSVNSALYASGSRAAAKTAFYFEGIAVNFELAKAEIEAYSVASKLTRGGFITKTGKIGTSGRLLKWFGYIPGKEGGLTRLALTFGRVGWKIAGGIVIFLQIDELTRPYTYYTEQMLLGAGMELSSGKARLQQQLGYLNLSKWNETLCANEKRLQQTGNRGVYPHANDPFKCLITKHLSNIQEQSKLWRESIVYKFMGHYSNWLTYVDNFHSEWNIAYAFYEELIEYSFLAKAMGYDPKKATLFNPLMHDDLFHGVNFTERIPLTAESLGPLMSSSGSLTLDGMNTLRAQKVIDLLPYVGRKTKDLNADPKFKSWDDVKKILTGLSVNITSYMAQSANSKDVVTLATNHFTKTQLTRNDLPKLKNYTLLIDTIKSINSAIENYITAYKSLKSSGPSRDRTPQENAQLYALYEKAALFINLKQFLGNPKPSLKGEVFLKTFDEYVAATYSPEQVKRASKITGSVAKDLLLHSLCSTNTILAGQVETKEMQNNVADDQWGKFVKFLYPRLTTKPTPQYCQSYDSLLNWVRNATVDDSAIFYLMKNISPTLMTADSSLFGDAWESNITSKIEVVYKKFDQSYQSLIQSDYLPEFGGEGAWSLVNMDPLEAYKKIQNQPRGGQLEIPIPWTNRHIPIKPYSLGGSILQTYVDEVDLYLKTFNDAMDIAIKQHLAQTRTSNGVDQRKYNYLVKRKQKYNQIANDFRSSFAKIALSFVNNDANVEDEYAKMLVSYVALIKGVGLIGDISVSQENVQEDGEIETKVIAKVSRDPISELILKSHVLEDEKEQIEDFVKSQQAAYNVSDANSKLAFTEMYLNNVLEMSFAGLMKLRIQSQPEVRHPFEEIKKTVESDKSAANPYNLNPIDILRLPLDDKNRIVPKPQLTYVVANEMTNQFLGVLKASQNLELLMEEVYFNVNILKAANIDNKYRDVERSKLKKYKANSMGGS